VSIGYFVVYRIGECRFPVLREPDVAAVNLLRHSVQRSLLHTEGYLGAVCWQGTSGIGADRDCQLQDNYGTTEYPPRRKGRAAVE
jgi:hypothetical protein